MVGRFAHRSALRPSTIEPSATGPSTSEDRRLTELIDLIGKIKVLREVENRHIDSRGLFIHG